MVLIETILEAYYGRAQMQRFQSIMVALNLVAAPELIRILEVVELFSKRVPSALSHIEGKKSGTRWVLWKVLVLVVLHVHFLNCSAR